MFDLVDQAVDFVLSKIALSIGTQAESIEIPTAHEILKEVVTEAVVNAVAHRDYTHNGSVQVMLFADRLEVWNPGGLPPSLTLEKLRSAHGSVPGNPLLAESLYLAEYIERMGTGTLDMIRQCVEANLPEPQFAVTNGFVATVRRESFAGQAEVQAGVQAVLSDKEAAMLRACLGGPVPSEALLATVGYSSRTRNFRKWLARLLREKLLELTALGKPTSPFQRYRLTEKGKAAITFSISKPGSAKA